MLKVSFVCTKESPTFFPSSVRVKSFCFSYLCNQAWIPAEEGLPWNHSDDLWGSQTACSPAPPRTCSRWGTTCRRRTPAAGAQQLPAGFLNPRFLTGTSSGGSADGGGGVSFQRSRWRNWRQSPQDLRQTDRQNKRVFTHAGLEWTGRIFNPASFYLQIHWNSGSPSSPSCSSGPPRSVPACTPAHRSPSVCTDQKGGCSPHSSPQCGQIGMRCPYQSYTPTEKAKKGN